MTLIVALFDPSDGPYAAPADEPRLDEGENAAGFEAYRTLLWGSEAIASRDNRYFPQLRHDNLFVSPEDMTDFVATCERIEREAEAIVTGLMASPPAQQRRLGLRGWFHPKPERAPALADNIRQYMRRFITAAGYARERNLGVCII